jgi:hypothetical protein
MVSQATPGYPALIQLGDDVLEGTPSYATITEVLDFNGPPEKADVDDVTNHDSPNGREEVLMTILRSGNVKVPCNYVPSSATQDGTTGLKYLLRNRTKRAYRVVDSDDAQSWVAFNAFVDEFDGGMFPVKGGVKAGFSLKPTGDYQEGQGI